MGFPKYYEDNCHIYFDRIGKDDFSSTKKYKQNILQHKCPFCECAFKNKEEMNSHIHSLHSKIKPRLYVNGSIIEPSNTIYIPEVKSVCVHKNGYNRTIRINGKIIQTDIAEDFVDLTTQIKDRISETLNCTISIGDNKYTIKKHSLYSLKSDLIDSYVLEWDKKAREGISIGSYNLNRTNLNAAELHYLKGVFNYYIGCQAKEQERYKRYCEANIILKEFVPTNALGLCIQKTIAFKYNWISTLSKLCEKYETKDDFWSACCFFQNKKVVENLTHSPEIHLIFIEDDLLEILKAILAFQRKDYEYVNEYLLSHDVFSVSDKNLRDKIFLLEAHMAALNNEKEDAKYLFEQITNPELFIAPFYD